METGRHRQQMNLLIDSLAEAWKDRDDFYVAGNMFVYYSETQAKKNDFRGPDVFVVMDTVRKERKSWVVWEEDGRTPDVVIELISESTATIDRGEKMRIYSRLLKVSEYFIYDPFTFELTGYELDSRSGDYHRIEPDERGWLPVHRLGLHLGLAQAQIWETNTTWLRWIDDQGKILLHSWELAKVASEQAEEATRLADKASLRAETLAAKLAEYERRFGTLAEDEGP